MKEWKPKHPDPSPEFIAAFCASVRDGWDYIERVRRRLPVRLVPYRGTGIIVKQATRQDAIEALRQSGVEVNKSVESRPRNGRL